MFFAISINNFKIFDSEIINILQELVRWMYLKVLIKLGKIKATIIHQKRMQFYTYFFNCWHIQICHNLGFFYELFSWWVPIIILQNFYSLLLYNTFRTGPNAPIIFVLLLWNLGMPHCKIPKFGFLNFAIICLSKIKIHLNENTKPTFIKRIVRYWYCSLFWTEQTYINQQFLKELLWYTNQWVMSYELISLRVAFFCTSCELFLLYELLFTYELLFISRVTSYFYCPSYKLLFIARVTSHFLHSS